MEKPRRQASVADSKTINARVDKVVTAAQYGAKTYTKSSLERHAYR